MRVLVFHNQYRHAGGEDAVAQEEVRLLRANGIDVVPIWADNSAGALRLALGSAWSRDSHREALRLCRQHRPDVVHMHNFWMKLSPSVHAACREYGAATVQTLHNFRLLCTNALLMREGRPCEDCVGRSPWRGVARRCYRGSFAASAAVARMIAVNRARGTWDRDVDAFIALAEHSRSRFIAGGLPASRLFVKPNFVEDPGEGAPAPSSSDLIVFAGRLSEEKGVAVLLAAWADGSLGRRGRLVIAGDGPARRDLEERALRAGLAYPSLTFVGHKKPGEVLDLVRSARAVVVPSVVFENFPRIVAEAFSLGRPVIASGTGALGEIVRHGRTGLFSGVAAETELREALNVILTNGPLADRLGTNARAEYLARYTPERNYRALMGIYRFAIDRRGGAVPEALAPFEAAAVTA